MTGNRSQLTAGATLLATLLAAAAPARAQVVTAGPDSAVVSTPPVTDASRRTAKLFGIAMTEPSKAGLLAVMLPGAGQIYNRKFWKLPLVYGAIGGTLYGEFFYQSRYKEYLTALDDFANKRKPSGPNAAQIRDSSYAVRGLRVYRTQRDVFIAYSALAYSLTVLDAVVDAHLKDFDISDDLGLQWQPTLIWMPTAAVTPGLSLTLTLNNTRSRRPLK
ncbi:DUF5683 domain-containing protein [Hymenobacter chitinivorans]|uniref:DUF5683 domain-containing protein n=1 Tax=Hymenobacter chitinivorans DSM 11115 TaxID=1121954 RepID=A0A2M9AQQ5_9BACT|nr:DUF5683 domain-containing protein [Hymenobacter chitinivorans]PJJ48036.1 hypothetical protein CLV45_4729 [Hymenobacter chitinivorans DSM 11115]